MNYQQRCGPVPQITPGAAKAALAAVAGRGHFDTAHFRNDIYAISVPRTETGEQLGGVHTKPKKIGIASPYRAGRRLRQDPCPGHKVSREVRRPGRPSWRGEDTW